MRVGSLIGQLDDHKRHWLMPCRKLHRRHSRLLVRCRILAAMAMPLLLTRGVPAQPAPQAFPANPSSASPAPAAATALPPTAPGQQIESYPLDDESREVFIAWQQYATNRQDLRVAIDERTSQVLVFAEPGVHAQIRQQLAAKAAAQAPPAKLAAPAGPVVLELRNMTAADLHPRLERLLAHPLPATLDASGEWQSFAVEASPGVGVTINVHTPTGQVRIDGPPLQVAAWRSVVEALDSPPLEPGKVTQLVATKPANHERVKKTLQVLQSGSERANDAASLVSMLFQQQDGAAAPPDAADASPPTDPPPGQTPAGEATPGNVQTAIDAAQLAEAAGGLLGPVQVEFVEGLDVIVLRGAERDVQRVMEIINQIEQLSAVTVPAIEIHPLVHVDSVQIAALLARLYDPAGVLGSRIGSVGITPLGKPNALLLIGRKENVRMAVELIQRLDQPVIPTSRFEVFSLQHASATEAKTLIDSFLGQAEDQEQRNDAVEEYVEDLPTLGPRALVVADPRTNALIVSASPRDIAEIAALVARIDTPGATAELKVFTVINGDAEALAQMLRSLFSIPEGAQAAEGGGLSGGGPVRMQFSVDARTNSIIAAGSREDLAVVEAILLRLDEGDLRERVTTVHKLNNAFAENVAQALNQWLQTERQVEAAADLAISPFEQIEREVIIVPELATNSLIVSATPRFYNEIMGVVRELDERPPMVLIQVLIAEVRLNDTDEFGVELGLQDSLLFDRSLLSDVQTITTTTQDQGAGGAVTTTTQQQIINANGQPGFNFNNQSLGNNLSSAALATAANVATQGLSSFSLNRVNSDLGFGGFVFSASSNSVSILLRALQEKRRLEVLSRPQLMALDGQPGQVQVGQNVPRILATSVDPLAGTTNTITYEPVGLILQVVPRISPDGLVVMQITANKSEVGPEAEGIPISISPQGQVLRAPRIEITQALTTVSALSGQTVVLGGLLQTRKFDVHRRVPLISDIPLLGNLFRYDSVAEERRELLIILTPQIIYNKFDSDLVKQIESSRMSWILSDVINVHGEAGLRSRCDEWYEGEMESVYPSYVPEEGVLPLSPGSWLLGEEAACETPEYAPSSEAAPTGEMLPVPVLTPPTE
jgi:type II secretion system protein D